MSGYELATRIRAMGGCVRSRWLTSRGVTRLQLARAVERGALVRVRHGVYAAPDAEPAVVEAAAHGGEVCCVSALRRRGVWVLEPQERLHVRVGRAGRVHAHPGCRCVTHHDGDAAAFGAVSLVHALVQAASCLGAEAFFVAFESAWRLGLLTRADRAEVRLTLPARFRYLVDLARPDADSGLESLLRLRLSRLGISVESQVLIPGVGRVDFLVAGCLIIEVDGRLNHEGASLRHKDLVRDAEAAAIGYETLRFDYSLVVFEWTRVERAVLARLDAIRRLR
ncbi:type IV toxin-antitoxin system AbiEi family antitoxin domain-containing protein [Microbacterium sp. 2P01SA-2]|uniref:type IV toxin-antitoxin system AbiEi family antitoxin domain-containing protein n=1 Tax=unclassified Microbacterium TaxID=2609290 RepID=UPI0039A308EE